MRGQGGCGCRCIRVCRCGFDCSAVQGSAGAGFSCVAVWLSGLCDPVRLCGCVADWLSDSECGPLGFRGELKDTLNQLEICIPALFSSAEE